MKWKGFRMANTIARAVIIYKGPAICTASPPGGASFDFVFY